MDLVKMTSFWTKSQAFFKRFPFFTKRESNIGEQRKCEVPAGTKIESEKSCEQKKPSERSDFTLCTKVQKSKMSIDTPRFFSVRSSNFVLKNVSHWFCHM